jgi:CheY-like chemotaxis protein
LPLILTGKLQEHDIVGEHILYNEISAWRFYRLTIRSIRQRKTVLSWLFGKKNEPAPEASPPPEYALTETPTEQPGGSARLEKNQLEARLGFLQQKATALTPAEQIEIQHIEKHLRELLGYREIEQVHQAYSPPQVAVTPARSGARQIVIAEDDPELIYLLDFMLKRHQFDVIHVDNGQKMLDLLTQIAPPALISLDIMLPYIDGVQVLQHIRKTPGWEKVPVIMLTSKSDEHTIGKALEMGANDYVCKPFQPAEFISRVQRLLQ